MEKRINHTASLMTLELINLPRDFLFLKFYDDWNRVISVVGMLFISCSYMFISMGWDYVSEQWPPMGLLVHLPDDIWARNNGANVADRGKLKNSEKSLSQCHCVYHKSHVDWLRHEPGPPQWESSNQLPEAYHGLVGINWIRKEWTLKADIRYIILVSSLLR
jgi:hypothetical protein